MRIARIAFFAAATCAAAAASAAAQSIDCPTDSVRAEITTRLPPPWWQTPQQGRLVDTDVMNIGGKRTLVCRYRAYGGTVSVMREMPRGARRCTPRRGGFMCDRGRDDRRDMSDRGRDDRDRPRGGVNHVSGSIDVRQTWMFDLDSGRLTKNRREADLWFEAETPTRRFLTPQNGAAIAVMGMRRPDYRDCARAKLSSRRVNLRALRRGVYLCMVTNRKRVAMIEITRDIRPSPAPISLGFQTYR